MEKNTRQIPIATPTACEKAARRGVRSKELVKEIAMDIGKEVVAYVEVMYPTAITSTPSTFKLSLRNCIHNEIMDAIKVHDGELVLERLKQRKHFRRQWVGAYRDLRKQSENKPE